MPRAFDHSDKVISGVTDSDSTFFVGSEGVVEIKEHSAQGEGDRWFYDVHFQAGQVRRLFEPKQVYFTTETPDDDIPF